mmetsp:Transcript_26605/g.68564  ORF Transcript_26605/g.68564 Transcript_26605/m.68564 type:complete len:84 (-) Transcript_26605:539-790(-)
MLPLLPGLLPLPLCLWAGPGRLLPAPPGPKLIWMQLLPTKLPGQQEGVRVGKGRACEPMDVSSEETIKSSEAATDEQIDEGDE